MMFAISSKEGSPAGLVRFIAESLVDRKESIDIQEVETDRSYIIELSVHPKEVGKVIGRSGRVARSIRTLISSSNLPQKEKRYHLEILD